MLKKNTEKTLYILDEPTIGLHYHDVNNLMNVLYKLRNSGSSILIVEHNLDVISRADYIIDLGPEGGENGGFLQYMGSIKKFASSKNGETSNYLQQYMKKFSWDYKGLVKKDTSMLKMIKNKINQSII